MIATPADFDETHHAFRNTCRSRIEASWSFGPILLRGPAPPQSRSSISIFRFSPRRLSRSGHVDMILPGRGPACESVPCVVGHGRIIRPRVRTSVGPGRPSERQGRVAGRELAERPAVDPGGGRAPRCHRRGDRPRPRVGPAPSRSQVRAFLLRMVAVRPVGRQAGGIRPHALRSP